MTEERSHKKITIKEYHGKDYGLFFEVSSILYDAPSNFQRITVIDTESVGRVLLLDGLVMFSEMDEFIYHEMIVHPAFLIHPDPRKILVIGGGDGGTVREILKYPVEKVYLVEIDQEVIQVAKNFFPYLAKSLDSHKVEIINNDGAKFLNSSKEIFDVIIIDSSDPVGPSISLFTEEFLKDVLSHLSPTGIFVSQSGSAIFHKAHLKKFFSMVRENFKIAKIYLAPVITYPGTIWTFIIGSSSLDLDEIKREPLQGLKFYNFDIHKSAFSLPNFLKEIVD